MPETGQIAAHVGDTPTENIENPFHLHFSGALRGWLEQESLSFAITTYEGAKLVLIGPGLQGGTIVTERNFERCMALCIEGSRNIWLSTHHHIWQLENGIEDGQQLDGWDRVYLPRKSYVTGGVDMHDLAIDKDGRLLGVVTQYNCIAKIGEGKGSFSPYWRPSFITEIIAEDRCHLNGFCLNDDKEPAYASAVGISNENDGWRDHKQAGGVIIDIQSDEIIAEGLSMPHTPRLYKDQLWFLEAGKGWLCRLDPLSGEVERLLWRPGFLRGLRFEGSYAFICSSAPRDKTFEGLPLEEELQKRDENPRCAIDVVDIEKMEVIHSLEISGSVKELYDIALMPNCRQPLLYGVEGEDIRKIVVLGSDETGQGGLGTR